MSAGVLDEQIIIPYGDIAYWDIRFENDRKKHGQTYSYDWHATFDAVWNSISTFLEGIKEPQSKRILIVGCGNSILTERLFKEGYTNITNVDVSAVVIRQMQQRYAHLEGLKFLVMDVRKLDALPSSSFDIVIDKGTLDTLFAGYDFINDVPRGLQEICRVVVPGGFFFCISHGSLASRSLYLKTKKLKWRLESLPIVSSADIMLYTMVKFDGDDHRGGGGANEGDETTESNTAAIQQKAPAEVRSCGASLIRKKEDAGKITLGKVRDDDDLPQLSRSVGFVLPVPVKTRRISH